MLTNPDLHDLTNRQIQIPWSTGFEFLDKESDCWLYQIPQREDCPLSELLMTPVSDDLWPDIWGVTVTVYERKGILVRLAGLMGDRHINILLANSITVDQSRSHIIRMVIDCSAYKSSEDGGFFDRINRSNVKLRGLQRDLEIELIEDLCFLRPMHPGLFISRNMILWNLYQEKTRRPMPRKRKLIISEGLVELPRDVMVQISESYSDSCGIASGKLGIPLGLICSDQYSDLVRVFVLFQGLGMIPIIIVLRNRPGAIAAAADLLQKNEFNILASRAWSSDSQGCTTTWLLLKDLAIENLPVRDQKTREKVEAIILGKSASSLRKYRPVLIFPDLLSLKGETK